MEGSRDGLYILVDSFGALVDMFMLDMIECTHISFLGH